MIAYTASEMMVVTASRALRNDHVCFVGIGAPSAACNLARLTHAPDIALIYESGTIGVRPDILPLSIGDGELADTAIVTVSVPEMFQYWLQGGRIDIGFLGAAQLDRFGNINTTVIGHYDRPKVRLPGAGGAPEIATHCREVYLIIEHSPRAFVEEVDFVTTLGFGPTGAERSALGIETKGPTLVVTDLALLRPEQGSNELIVTSLHPGVTREEVMEKTGWPIRFAPEPGETPSPTETELDVLRGLQERTAAAHQKEG